MTYSADILARDSSGGYVVIENQLAKTDHDHLGKLITYGAVLGASTVIWIAPHFTDEHHKALDWLNDNTTDELSFYGVQVELWSIDESLPAVRFNTVSRPAEIIRQAQASKSGELSENRQLQLAWWIAFRDALMASLPSGPQLGGLGSRCVFGIQDLQLQARPLPVSNAQRREGPVGECDLFKGEALNG